MLTRDKAQLMIYCGALHDIAEKSNEEYTKPQLTLVTELIEGLLMKDDMVKSELKKISNDLIPKQ